MIFWKGSKQIRLRTNSTCLALQFVFTGKLDSFNKSLTRVLLEQQFEERILLGKTKRDVGFVSIGNLLVEPISTDSVG